MVRNVPYGKNTPKSAFERDHSKKGPVYSRKESKQRKLARPCQRRGIRSGPAHTHVSKSLLHHLGGLVEIPPVHDDGESHCDIESAEIEFGELRPVGEDEKR